MKEIMGKQFGTIIAFLLPGFIYLWGSFSSSSGLEAWLSASSDTDASVGRFLFVVLASLAVGLLLSAIRWAVIDQLHHRTGVKMVEFDFSQLSNPDKYAAFQGMVEAHYRFYQYYANTLVAMILAYITNRVQFGNTLSWSAKIAVVFVCVMLFLGSRDALKKFYNRAQQTLSG